MLNTVAIINADQSNYFGYVLCCTVSVTKNLTSLKNKKKKRKQTNVTSKKWLIKLPNNGSKHSSPCVVEVSLD